MTYQITDQVDIDLQRTLVRLALNRS
jgi:hypothetical protein